MRIRPRDVGVHQRRTAPFAAVLRRRLHGPVGGQEIGAVHLLPEQPRKTGDQFGDAAARGLAFDGNGDGVAVVLHQVEQRQVAQARRVQGFPEFALAGGAVARGSQRHFAFRPAVPARLRTTHRLEKLRAGGRGGTDDVPALVPPVGGHLPAAGGRVGGRAHRLLQHLERGYPQGQAQRAVAIIKVEPIVAGAQHHAGRHLHRLVSGAADLKEDPVLALQRHFAVIQPPRGVHDAKRADQLLGIEAFVAGGSRSMLRRRGHRRESPRP